MHRDSREHVSGVLLIALYGSEMSEEGWIAQNDRFGWLPAKAEELETFDFCSESYRSRKLSFISFDASDVFSYGVSKGFVNDDSIFRELQRRSR